MKEPIDWRYPVRRDGKRVASDLVNEAADELLDHWRALAVQEREEARKCRWQRDELLRLSTAYPQVMREKLESEWAKRNPQ